MLFFFYKFKYFLIFYKSFRFFLEKIIYQEKKLNKILKTFRDLYKIYKEKFKNLFFYLKRDCIKKIQLSKDVKDLCVCVFKKNS